MPDEPNKAAVNRGSDGKFLPGNNANPKGRPRKEVSLTSLLKKYLEEVPDVKIKGGGSNKKTWAELIVQAWLFGAYKGNARLLTELLDRVEGKAPQPIIGGDGGPVELKVIYGDISP